MKPFLRQFLSLGSVASALFLLGACQGTGASSAATVNQKCPMSGEPVAESTTTFDGQAVGFCCDTCLGKFNKLSTDEKKAKVMAAMPPK